MPTLAEKMRLKKKKEEAERKQKAERKKTKPKVDLATLDKAVPLEEDAPKKEIKNVEEFATDTKEWSGQTLPEPTKEDYPIYHLTQPTKINANKVFNLIKSMKGEDYPAYATILNQFHKYKRKSNVLQLIKLIEDNWAEVVE